MTVETRLEDGTVVVSGIEPVGDGLFQVHSRHLPEYGCCGGFQLRDGGPWTIEKRFMDHKSASEWILHQPRGVRVEYIVVCDPKEVELQLFEFTRILQLSEELLSKYLDWYEGDSAPSEIVTKNVVCSILGALNGYQ